MSLVDLKVDPVTQDLELTNILINYGANIQFAQDFISAKLIGHRYELTGEAGYKSRREAFVDRWHLNREERLGGKEPEKVTWETFNYD